MCQLFFVNRLPTSWWFKALRYVGSGPSRVDDYKTISESLGLSSPELIVDRTVGVGSDIWSSGCTLLEVRTERRLFDTFDNDVDD